MYIPLGGNRKGIARRDANLLLTFLVSGLWHGANWTFLVWGGLHGLCQVAEDHMPAPLRKRKSLLLRIVGVPLTFAIFVTTFTIFRTSSLGNAAAYFAGILHNCSCCCWALRCWCWWMCCMNAACTCAPGSTPRRARCAGLCTNLPFLPFC